MNKKIIIGIVLVIIAIIGVGAIVYNTSKSSETERQDNSEENNQLSVVNKNSNENEIVDNKTDNDKNTGSKTLVVYFSAQNHTKTVAEKIAKNLDADIFEIEPEEEYTSDDLNWNNSDSRVSKEHNDESLRDTKLKTTKVDNWDEYDTVLIGYPIWWGIAAWPVDTFVKANDFSGKTVIPFCTSSSSGLGQSGKNLAEEANSGDWQAGQRFSSSASDADIKKWADSLK
mgnify:FL=1